MRPLLKPALTATIMCCLLSTPVAVSAAQTYQGRAEVIAVHPLKRSKTTLVPVKQCHWQQLPQRVQHYPHRYERRVIERRAKRCRTVEQSRTVQHITGYNVTLRYQGETFTKFSRTHPGSTMPVSIAIRPLVN